MHEKLPFNWLTLASVPESVNHVVMAAIVAFVLVMATLVARGQLLRAMGGEGGGLVPEPKLTFRNFFEIVAERLYQLTESILGHHDAPVYFPLIGTLFVYIIACNLVGLIPGLLPPTDNMNTTFAMGVFVFFYYNYAGIKTHGLKYFKHFLGPVWFVAPLMLLIEIVSHIFRPLSLALRLRGNILGDHIVLGIFTGMVPYLVPVVFYALGLFVACIQAFVFALLTIVYIHLSTAHEEH